VGVLLLFQASSRNVIFGSSASIRARAIATRWQVNGGHPLAFRAFGQGLLLPPPFLWRLWISPCAPFEPPQSGQSVLSYLPVDVIRSTPRGFSFRAPFRFELVDYVRVQRDVGVDECQRCLESGSSAGDLVAARFWPAVVFGDDGAEAVDGSGPAPNTQSPAVRCRCQDDLAAGQSGDLQALPVRAPKVRAGEVRAAEVRARVRFAPLRFAPVRYAPQEVRAAEVRAPEVRAPEVRVV
jgi:hypothetical protein